MAQPSRGASGAMGKHRGNGRSPWSLNSRVLLGRADRRHRPWRDRPPFCNSFEARLAARRKDSVRPAHAGRAGPLRRVEVAGGRATLRACPGRRIGSRHRCPHPNQACRGPHSQCKTPQAAAGIKRCPCREPLHDKHVFGTHVDRAARAPPTGAMTVSNRGTMRPETTAKPPPEVQGSSGEFRFFTVLRDRWRAIQR